MKKLHEAGEFNDYLNPVLHTRIDSDEEDDEKMTEKKKVHAGTNRKVMYYKTVVSTCTFIPLRYRTSNLTSD